MINHDAAAVHGKKMTELNEALKKLKIGQPEQPQLWSGTMKKKALPLLQGIMKESKAQGACLEAGVHLSLWEPGMSEDEVETRWTGMTEKGKEAAFLQFLDHQTQAIKATGK